MLFLSLKEGSLSVSPASRMLCVIFLNIVGRKAVSELDGFYWASLMGQVVENPPATQEMRFRSLGQEDPGEGNGNPLQYSWLENPMEGGAW